jgi:hypothetical protein
MMVGGMLLNSGGCAPIYRLPMEGECYR